MRKFFSLVFLMVLLFATLPPVFQFVPNVKANPDWLTGWTYRKSHVISNATGAGTNYQIRIKVHYSNQQFSQVWDSGNIATGTGADTARNIVIDGNYLYAVSDLAKKLVIYDISNPSSPVQKSLTSFDHCGGHDIRKKGNYVFISCAEDATSSDGVMVYNVSDVTSPSYVTTINLGGQAHGMFISGDYLYVCCHTLDKFAIVDISDPTNPVVKGTLSGTTYFNGAHDVHVDGNYAYVANYQAGVGEYGFVVVDVSDKDNPEVVGYIGEDHSNSHVFKVGNYCYVGTHDDNGFRVYDVSTPTSPSYVGLFFEDESQAFGYWIDDYDSNTLTAIAIFSHRLYLIDISNPTSPSIKTSILIGSSSRPKNVAYSGGYFYVSWNDENNHEWHIRNYQLTTASDSGENVYLNEHCRTDFGDIRFTDDDGTTLLDYWMEEKVDSDYAVFWVEIADDLSSSNATIYIYYGKSDATTTSNGTNTFLFFDDFEGTNLDSDKWSQTGNVSVSNSECTIGGGTQDSYIESANTFGVNKCLRSRSKITNLNSLLGSFKGSTDWITIRSHSSYSGTLFTHIVQDGDSSHRTYQTAVSYDNNYHISEIRWIDGNNAKTVIDDTIVSFSNDSNVPDGDTLLPIRHRALSHITSGTSEVVDWTLVRKYVDPEPSHGSWGTEETAAQTYAVELNKPFSLTFSLLHQTNFQIPLTFTSSTTFTNKLQALYNVILQFNPLTTFIILLQGTYGVLLNFVSTVTFTFTALTNYIIDFVFQLSVTFTELMRATYGVFLNFAPSVTYTLNNIANYVIDFIFQPSVNFVLNIVHTISEGIIYFVELTFTPIVTFTNMLQATYNVILDFTPLVTFTNLLQTFYQVLLNFPANVVFTLNMIAGYFVNFIFQPTVTFTLNILYQAFAGIHYFVDLVFTPIITWSLGTFQTALLWFHNPTNILIAGLVIFTACFLLHEFSKWRW